MNAAAALVLVGTPIGNLGDLSERAIRELRSADVLAAEDTRRTRKLLSALDVPAGRRLVSVREHNEAAMAERLVGQIRDGARVVYVSDAGMPGIADPGERLVRACADAGVPVEVVPGPSAALAALVLSGLPTERFAFEGFLPRKGRHRKQRLAAVATDERTVVVFESPHRLARTLTDLAEALGPDRPAAVVRELTKLHEEVWRGSIGDAAAAVATEPRGEYVVVLGPAPPVAPPDDDDVARAVAEALDSGLSARDAASRVSQRLGVSRNAAYQIAVATRQDG